VNAGLGWSEWMLRIQRDIESELDLLDIRTYPE
ncbi:uncharacterized protein METZ01_LOCUS382442, partial [marine metagenome]